MFSNSIIADAISGSFYEIPILCIKIVYWEELGAL